MMDRNVRVRVPDHPYSLFEGELLFLYIDYTSLTSDVLNEQAFTVTELISYKHIAAYLINFYTLPDKQYNPFNLFILLTASDSLISL